MVSEIKLAATWLEERFPERNRLCEDFFDDQPGHLALTCREMEDRLAQGGRLLASGRGPSAADALHLSAEFVHPVMGGKRGLTTVALLGRDGGENPGRGMADFPPVVRSHYVPRTEEVQRAIDYRIRECLENLARG